MKTKDIINYSIFFILWTSFIVFVLMLEFYEKSASFYILSSVSFVLLICYHVFAYRNFKRYKKVIKDKQNKILKDLKPDGPLRTYGFMEEEVRKIPKYPEFENVEYSKDENVKSQDDEMTM